MKSEGEHKEEQVFVLEKHKQYLLQLEKSSDLESIGNYLSSHLKMGGAYWSLGSLKLLGQELSEEQIDNVTTWLFTCQNPDGGFGGNTHHDSHITSSHYSLLTSILLHKYTLYQQIAADKVAHYVSTLFDTQTGGFWGDDSHLEQDVRFSYCGVALLKILNRLELIDVELASEFVLKCNNYDGSFGGLQDMESHGAYVFCAVGTLQMLDTLHLVDDQLLAQWLAERQTPSGGFNGRPEKLPDVCYSWWIYSSLLMLKAQTVVQQSRLVGYILQCQDYSQGGISDKPGNQQDVFHTFFGLAALSLLPSHVQQHLVPIQPVYALPQHLLDQPHFTHLRSTSVPLIKGSNI